MSPADFLRQLWSGNRLLVSVAVLLLLANLALGITLQQYLVPTVNRLEQQLIQSEAELRGGGTGTSPARLFAQGERDLAAFRERIPPHQELTGLVVELQDLADEAGLSLNQISYAPEQEKESGLLRYKLNFTLEGSYRDIKQFVHVLEQSPRLIIIGQIGLQGVGQESDTDVRLQLSLETLFRAGVS